MMCEHPLHRLIESVDYKGKLFCRNCEKRFVFNPKSNTFTEWLPELLPDGSKKWCEDCGWATGCCRCTKGTDPDDTSYIRHSNKGCDKLSPDPLSPNFEDELCGESDGLEECNCGSFVRADCPRHCDDICDEEPECTWPKDFKALVQELHRNYYTKEEIDSALDQMERRVDKKASQIVGMNYSKEEVDDRIVGLLDIIKQVAAENDRWTKAFNHDVEKFISRFLTT